MQIYYVIQGANNRLICYFKTAVIFYHKSFIFFVFLLKDLYLCKRLHNSEKNYDTGYGQDARSIPFHCFQSTEWQ